jgi:hypothetical protein
MYGHPPNVINNNTKCSDQLVVEFVITSRYRCIYRNIFKELRIQIKSNNVECRDSCREHFKKLKILPLQSQYILSLLLFVVNNRGYFMANSKIHNINTRTKWNLHQPMTNLTTYQKGMYYSGIKVFNSLPTQIKDLSHNSKQFISALKNFLYLHSFYTLGKYFSCNKNWNTIV